MWRLNHISVDLYEVATVGVVSGAYKGASLANPNPALPPVLLPSHTAIFTH